MPSGSRLLVASAAATRLAAAADWLDAHSPDVEILVVGPSWEAADGLVRAAAARALARFGTTRLTLDRLAARLAAPILARARRTPASGLSLTAVAARAVHLLLAKGALSYFVPVAKRPGFPSAVARTLEELRMNGVGTEALRGLPDGGADLAALAACVESELDRAGLADRAAIFAAASESAAGTPPPPYVGLPLLLLDLPIASTREATLLGALVRRAPAVLATATAGDERTIAVLESTLGCTRHLAAPPPVPANSLSAAQAHLFQDSAPPAAALDGTVTLRSWPGEARECVEIARGIRAAAARGVPFDRIAVFLRSPAEYRAHLQEAFRRASLPVFFARGTTRPDAGGRALLALLACAAERLSARRFAEYVSLAQVPDPDASRDPDARWVPPADDLLPTGAPELPPVHDERSRMPDPDPDTAAVIEGTLRAPWRWERLLVDASVIGEQKRWAGRLAGLEEELRLRRQALGDEETHAALLDRQLRDLGHLCDFALPLIERLAALPQRATWGGWLQELRELAAAALRDPEPVLATLAELEPMAPVGPVDLDEVQLVLAPRLRDLTVPPPRRPYGAVFVASTEAARGLAFDVVFVPGLAEKLFPRKIVEDPILLDAHRRALDIPTLAIQPARVAAERLSLRLAVGAACEHVALSYPRLDVEQARPRVPSFYALEALRASEGTLPGFDELGVRAEPESGGRLGWPAPEQPEQAIDEAEYDLALLGPLLQSDPATTVGTASYLLTANVHLGRALRARARRWLSRWTPNDGLVDPDDLARAALVRHQLGARAFSPTALQNFAACPYRFFLQAVHRLAPREEAVAVEVLDPLTRGALFHEVQFEVLTRLRDDGLLPVTPDRLEAVLAIVDRALDAAATQYAEKLFPAIPRVWDDGITAVRADLREWLRRAAAADDGWIPHRFELGFGLADRDRPHADPASVPDPVPVAGQLRLRGSIDLVERHVQGVLRATDHKTGKARAKAGVVVGGGEVLQPVLYALACEQILREPVAGGRLYYCSADGGYEERDVPLDDESRASAETVARIIGAALAEGFFPAAPARDACRWCDYRPVCGPYEERRSARKPAARLAELNRLRALP
ncbi:MAG: PD-(D/E)XK nuclease family protein [Deltaproteobacteria bacterium]|nr:MAG: PD-(D/E)XK nuclease family protein [Deltaproteobacteria bacterium]